MSTYPRLITVAILSTLVLTSVSGAAPSKEHVETAKQIVEYRSVVNLGEFVATAASRCDSDLTNYGMGAIDRHDCQVYFTEVKRFTAAIEDVTPRYAALSAAISQSSNGALQRELSLLRSRMLQAISTTTRTDEHFQFLSRAARQTPTMKTY
jgi:hypothetical protein